MKEVTLQYSKEYEETESISSHRNWINSSLSGGLITLFKIFIVLAVLVGILFSQPFLACGQEVATQQEKVDNDEPAGFEGEEDGFGDEEGDDFFEVKVDLSKIKKVESSAIQLYGFFREELAYAFAIDEPYTSKIRSVLNLGVDVRFSENWKGKFVWNGFYDDAYNRKDRDEFTDETLEAYESESELRDFYIDGAFSEGVRLKIGRQVLAWGESETSQIIDMVNPRDQREIGQVDIEDARIPVASSKIALIGSGIELDLVALHEFRASKTGVKGSPFDPFIRMRSAAIITDEEVPSNGGNNTEYLVRVFGQVPGSDMSLIWGDVYEDTPYLDVESFTIVPGPMPVLVLKPKYKRIKFVGFSANRAIGSTLLKIEAAKHYNSVEMRGDLQKQLASMSTPKLWEEKDLIRGMLGIEYTGIADLNVSFEVAGKKIENYEEELASDELSGTTSLMLTYDTLNQTLKYKAMLAQFFNNNGEVYRFTVTYLPFDAMEVSIGAIWYEASKEDAFIYPYEKQDRYLASLKYSF